MQWFENHKTKKTKQTKVNSNGFENHKNQQTKIKSSD